MVDSRRAIFITGAARGIGRALAINYARQGWLVGLTDADPDALEGALAEVGRDNGIALALDVRDRKQWDAALTRFAQASGGRLDVLVNNAGIVRYGWIEQFSEGDIDDSIDINLRGVLNGVRAALDLLKGTPGATLVNVASVAALRGNPKYGIYAATKFAVRGLSQSLDLELSRFGIKVVCVMPWSIETSILDGSAADGDMTMRQSMVRSGQTIYSADYAADAIQRAVAGGAAEVIVGEEGTEFIRRADADPDKLRAAIKKAVAQGAFDA